MADDLIPAGIITSPFGIMGLVKVKSFTEPIENISNFKLYDEGQLPLDLKVVNKGKYLTCKIDIIKTREDAEKARGKNLYIKRCELPMLLEEEEFYVYDLVGLTIYDQANNPLGVITRIYNFDASDIVEVKFYNGQTVMYPFIKEIFPEITKTKIKFIPPNFI